MRFTRREVVELGVAAGASLLTPPSRAAARSQSYIMRTIPSSGERVPAVGMGTRQFSNPEDAILPTLKETIRIFAERGGKLIDTSPTYGKAEVLTGDFVSELGVRDDLFLATKVSIRGQNQRQAGVDQMQQSFGHLHTEVVDLMQVHNLRDIDTQLPLVREQKERGRVRYVGMTTSSRRQYDDFVGYMERETLDFIQVDYSLGQRLAEERILPLALDRGMGVLVNLPFGRGRLFRKVGDRPLPDWAAEIDCTSWAQVFLKFIISHPVVTCPIPGTDKPEYAIDNLAAARGRLPDQALRKRMMEFYDSLPQ